MPFWDSPAVGRLQSILGYGWDSYFINTNNADYDRATEPLNQMEKILFFMLAVVLALGTVILTIFLSMRFSRGKIMANLIEENLLVFSGSFFLTVLVMLFRGAFSWKYA